MDETITRIPLPKVFGNSDIGATKMNNHEEDLRIIAEAESPPKHEEWCSTQRPYVITCNCRDVGWIHPLELFRNHFDPTYTKHLVEKAMKCDALAEENEALKAMVNELREAIFHATCDLAESDIANDDGLIATHNDLMQARKKTEHQSLADRDMRIAEAVREACANLASWEDSVTEAETEIRNFNLAEVIKNV